MEGSLFALGSRQRMTTHLLFVGESLGEEPITTGTGIVQIPVVNAHPDPVGKPTGRLRFDPQW